MQKTSAKGVGALAADVMAPVKKRRAGLYTNISGAWPEIVGDKLAQICTPLRLDWPRRTEETEPFKPASLVIACEPSRALFVEADSAALLSKINAFLGFHAVERLKIEQKLGAGKTRAQMNPQKIERPTIKPNPAQRMAIEDKLAGMEEGKLKDALRKLGTARLAKK